MRGIDRNRIFKSFVAGFLCIGLAGGNTGIIAYAKEQGTIEEIAETAPIFDGGWEADAPVTCAGEIYSDELPHEETELVGAEVYETAWSDRTKLPPAAGSYYLTTDVTCTGTWEPRPNTTLCLNGHTVTLAAKSNDDINVGISIVNKNVTICDYADGSGKLFVDNSLKRRGAVLVKDTRAALRNIAISGGGSSNSAQGGAVTLMGADSVLTMESCVLSGNDGFYAGGIYAGNGTLTMTDCVIEGNTCSEKQPVNQSGGLFVYKASVTMNGCAVVGNNCRNVEYSNADAGGVFIGASGTLFLNGCSVTGNSVQGAENCGGIYVLRGGRLNVSGETVISGNTESESGNGSNVFLGNGVAITLTDSMTAASPVAVSTYQVPTAARPVTITSGYEGKAEKEAFASEDPAYAVGIKNGELALGPALPLLYDPGEGIGEMGEDIAALGTGYKLPACAFTAPVGKAFAGWQVGNNTERLYDENESCTFTEAAESVTVKAIWKGEASSDPSIVSHSLALGGKIGVSFYMDLPEKEGISYEDSYMEFTVAGKNGGTVKVPYSEAGLSRDGSLYGFTCYVNSIQMADEITAVFRYDEGGLEKSIQETYSVKQYILSYLALADDETAGIDRSAADLVRRLADYGHYVQIYLSAVNGWTIGDDYAAMDVFYKTEPFTDDQVQSIIEKITAMGIAPEKSLNGDIEKITFSLGLDSATSLNVYLKPISGYKGSVSALVGGNSVAAVRQKNKSYKVTIAGIPAHKLDSAYGIEARTNSDPAVVTAKVSPLAYVKAMLESRSDADSKNAMAALYEYFEASRDYSIA